MHFHFHPHSGHGHEHEHGRHGHNHEHEHGHEHGRGHRCHERAGRPGIHPDLPFGGGGRRERVFASGDLKFAVLHLLADKPAHGYEIIRRMGELAGGDYAPSPGTIYPTLAMLEDLGWVVSAPQEGGRKEYRISADGRARLEEEREAVERILAHLERVKSRAHGRRPPEVLRAMENLKTALRLRLGGADADTALARRVSEILDRAAVEIERCQGEGSPR
jgi:DNA-binding PadR family transcriptional regulator